MKFNRKNVRQIPGSSAPLLPFVLLLLISTYAWPQRVPKEVDIQVHADQSQGALSPIWNYFGYDEPNYTYAANGKKLLGKLAALGPTPALFASTTC